MYTQKQTLINKNHSFQHKSYRSQINDYPSSLPKQPMVQQYYIPQIIQLNTSKRVTKNNFQFIDNKNNNYMYHQSQNQNQNRNRNHRRNSLSNRLQGSRKNRLLNQRNTEIEKNNRMLYEKIRKIMQKGSGNFKGNNDNQNTANYQNQKSENKLQNINNFQEMIQNPDFLNTKTTNSKGKSISLPQVNNNSRSHSNSHPHSHLYSHSQSSKQNSYYITNNNHYHINNINHINNPNSNSLRSTQSKSQLSNILQDRNSFMQKYFDKINQKHQKQKQTFLSSQYKDLGQYQINNWVIHVLIMDQKFILLKGIKTNGKKQKQVTKKYIWEKVRMKLQDSCEEGQFRETLKKWILSKFQFQL